MHYIEYLYYKVNGEGDEVKIGNNAGSNASTLTRTLSMPKNNVTVYAHTHKRETNDFTYGYVTGCEGMGYINVGKQHSSSDTQIEYSIDSPGSVIEGTTVLFGARAKAGYKFLGWYSDQAGNDAISGMNVADKAVTNPTGTYYAKFQSFAEPEAGKIKLLVRSATNAKEAYWCNGETGTDTPRTATIEGIIIKSGTSIQGSGIVNPQNRSFCSDGRCLAIVHVYKLNSAAGRVLIAQTIYCVAIKDYHLFCLRKQ